MKKKIRSIFVLILAATITVSIVSSAVAQDKSNDYIKNLFARVEAGKKKLVTENMKLSESEGKDFWPVYDQYQKDLEAIDRRIARLIESYAKDYRANTLTDEKARKLTDELVAIQIADAELLASYVPKLSKVLPPKKVALYMQIETKIRVALKYEMAENSPLLQW
jgi:hypothetical protein